MENRKQRLALIVIIGLVFSVASIQVASARNVVLKIATIAPEGQTWMNMMHAAADEVAQKTDGRVKFKFYPGGVMGDNKAVLRKIRIGQLQGGMVTSGSLSKFYPDNQIYNLPITFNSFEEVDFVRGHMDKLIVDGLRKGGFVTFGLAEGGFAYIMSKAPISSAGELRRHKIWIPEEDPISMATARSFGVTPIPLAVAEVRTALQTGLIDTVAVSPIGALALQWHTQVDYITDTPLVYLYAVLAIERRAFNKIAPEDQKVVNNVIERVFKEIDRINRKDNIKAMEVLRNQGIKLIKPNQQEQKEWAELAENVPRRMIESGSLSPNILHKFEKHLEEYRSKGAKSDG
jgi:TRAP-type C4-dicarboxylate transport system substrate-binding protein